MRAITDPYCYPKQHQAGITIHALNQNKRPVGFAPWPEEKPKKKRKKRK